MSLATVLALAATLHLYIGVRLVPALPATAGLLLAGLLVASALLAPAGFLTRRLWRPPAADRLTWVGMLFLGLFSSLLVLTLLRDLALVAAGIAGAGGPALRGASAAAVPLLAGGLTAVGFFNARRTAAVRRVRIPLRDLDPALDGLRIVQITDIHVGPTIKAAYLQAIVERVNALDPDVVARMLGRHRLEDPLERLTPREREVLALIVEGLSNHGIAERLHVGLHAVEKHVTNIFEKLELGKDRADHRRVLAVLAVLRA